MRRGSEVEKKKCLDMIRVEKLKRMKVSESEDSSGFSRAFWTWVTHVWRIFFLKWGTFSSFLGNFFKFLVNFFKFLVNFFKIMETISYLHTIY